MHLLLPILPYNHIRISKLFTLIPHTRIIQHMTLTTNCTVSNMKNHCGSGYDSPYPMYQYSPSISTVPSPVPSHIQLYKYQYWMQLYNVYDNIFLCIVCNILCHYVLCIVYRMLACKLCNYIQIYSFCGLVLRSKLYINYFEYFCYI